MFVAIGAIFIFPFTPDHRKSMQWLKQSAQTVKFCEIHLFTRWKKLKAKKNKRGPKPKPYRTYQKRYPKPLEEDIDKMVKEWKKEKGYV